MALTPNYTVLNTVCSLAYQRYGYRGRDTRNNLYVLPSGELVYYVAAVAVVYDRRRHHQRHYLGHTEDITWSVQTEIRYSSKISKNNNNHDNGKTKNKNLKKCFLTRHEYYN